MKRESNVTSWCGATVRIASVFALMLLGSGSAALAGQKITVSGNSIFSVDCPGFAIKLTGDLEGCLEVSPQSFTCDELNGFARYRERGEEHFVGDLLGEPGEFRTTYIVEATYASGSCEEFNMGGFPSLDQLTGGCDHRVKGVSGAFQGVSGLITFFDAVTGVTSTDGTDYAPGMGANNFLYAGELKGRTQ